MAEGNGNSPKAPAQGKRGPGRPKGIVARTSPNRRERIPKADLIKIKQIMDAQPSQQKSRGGGRGGIPSSRPRIFSGSHPMACRWRRWRGC
jgi:hypothetical protein